MYFHYHTLFKTLRLTFSRRYFCTRHAFFVVTFIVLFLVLRTIVWLVRWLDYIFFPGFRTQPIKCPIYIIGNPRSGTTFTHRLISMDEQFSFFKLYHTIFPAVIFYKFYAVLGRFDRVVRSPLRKLLNRLSRKGFKGWETIHKTGPHEAESDEMLFVYAMLSPLLGLLFPFLDSLDEAKFVDRLPAESRQKLMEYYKDSLKRHLYATGSDKILLEKVALIAGRLHSILEVIPDMRVVHLIRHPYESIPSLINMFYVPLKSLAPQVKHDSRPILEVAGMIFEYYHYLFELKKTFPETQFIEVRYEDLVKDPEGTVELIYRKLNITMSREYRDVLRAEAEKARHYKSKHKYSLEEYGLTRENVYEELKDIFKEYGFER